MTTQTNTDMKNLKSTSDLAVKIQKMARLAFDPAAAEGEAGNAAAMLVQIVRKHGLNFDGFKKLLGITSSKPKLRSVFPPDVLTFGKYMGQSLEWVFANDPAYLDWILREVSGKEQLKEQIRAFLKTKTK